MADYASFVVFVRNQGVNTSVLPDGNQYLQYAYNIAVEVVNIDLSVISPIIYDLCVYNLGMDNLINYAQDQINQTFWQDLRSNFGVNAFVPGVIHESHDETTGQSLETPEIFKTMTISNLQHLKTPYGRTYLQHAMQYGGLITAV